MTKQAVVVDDAQRQQRLSRLAADCASRAGAEGFTVAELAARLGELAAEKDRRQ